MYNVRGSVQRHSTGSTVQYTVNSVQYKCNVHYFGYILHSKIYGVPFTLFSVKVWTIAYSLGKFVVLCQVWCCQYSALNIWYYIAYIMQTNLNCFMYILYNVQYTLQSINYVVKCLQCRVYSISWQYAEKIVKCTVHSTQCDSQFRVYTIWYKVCTVQCTF